jgi:hypothetical protein
MTDLLGDFDDGPSPTDFPDGPRAPFSGDQSANADSMLGDLGDDDGFFPAPVDTASASAFAASAGPPSALIEWQRQKAQNIAEKDEQDEALSKELAANAQTARAVYFETIRTQQEKRARANDEADRVLIADLEVSGNPWQKVGKLINLQVAPVRRTDVSRFKTLLIQLKQ